MLDIDRSLTQKNREQFTKVCGARKALAAFD
jgi:hypothetical protein